MLYIAVFSELQHIPFIYFAYFFLLFLCCVLQNHNICLVTYGFFPLVNITFRYRYGGKFVEEKEGVIYVERMGKTFTFVPVDVCLNYVMNL